MKILLSPAKAMDLSKKLATNATTTPVFLEEANTLVQKLKKVSSAKLGGMMHLSKDLAELNHRRFQVWQPTVEKDENNAQVAAAFDGEVYRGLDAPSLSIEELEVAQEKIRILSGLYGVLRPLDVIYPYRLEMGTKWSVTPTKKNLYQFWGTKIAELLNKENTSGVIVNLASSEYFKAVDKKTIQGRVITPIFKEFKNGEYKVIMVFAKRARGQMARYIVQKNIMDPEGLKLFDVDGYHFDANLSQGDEWVFTR